MASLRAPQRWDRLHQTAEFVVVALPIVNKTSRRGPQFAVVQRVFWLNAKHSVLGVCALSRWGFVSATPVIKLRVNDPLQHRKVSVVQAPTTSRLSRPAQSDSVRG